MKILHLYHDIMNLYGEYGNICALERMLEKNKLEVIIDRYSIGDEVNLLEYDLIYVGAGTEKKQKMVLEDFIKYKNEINQFIEEGRVLLMTGNSFEMMGETLRDSGGKVYSGLSVLPYASEEKNIRLTSDVILLPIEEGEPVVGFVNKCSKITGIMSPLFKVERGMGNEGNGGSEGVRYMNFFGTYVTGPVLVKNPAFLIFIIKCLLDNRKKRDESFAFPEVLDETWMEREKAGYRITLEKLRG